jgi:ribosomal protein L22
VRSYHGSPARLATPLTLYPKSPIRDVKELKEKNTEPDQISKRALQRAKDKQKADEQQAMKQSQVLGSLSPNSIFADEVKQPQITATPTTTSDKDQTPQQPDYPEDEDSLSPFSARNPTNMAVVLNPRPNARARWQRRMVIRDIRHRGRLTKAMSIARSERSHLSRSHFFKTSMKKLAPLARQIAGKSIDEAITQMRFSNKKAAIDVRQHLITARNEAIVARGMGLHQPGSNPATASTATHDPSITPPLPSQRAGRGLKRTYNVSNGTAMKVVQNQTDIYIAEAWTNRGPYGQEADYRAKGRINIMRPPYTGLSVLLKEEKTRTREKDEKEAKAIRKRMGKNMWTQLPDRPIVRQSQQVLW